MFGEAVEKAHALLQEAGYGVLPEIDAQTKLKEKLEQQGRTRIAAVEPGTMLSVVGNKELEPIAEQVRRDLSRVVEELVRD